MWWDEWFVGLARYVATASKDPSTQCGAVIVDASRRVVSLGYNGFPRGVDDSQERYADREVKLRMVAHAEANAILFAGRPLSGCTLYTYPFQPCAGCAKLVIQSGIRECVAPVTPADLLERWGVDLSAAWLMFAEAGVVLRHVPTP